MNCGTKNNAQLKKYNKNWLHNEAAHDFLSTQRKEDLEYVVVHRLKPNAK